VSVAGCATAPADDVESTTSETRDDDAAPARGLPPSQPPTAPTPEDPGGDAGSVDDGGADAGPDAAVVVAQSVVIKLVPTRTDWLVAGQAAPFQVNLDAKNCNIFGNACDADVSLTVTIDAPATAPATTPTCSQQQAGTGVRQCSQGATPTKNATLKPGDDVKVRFHAEAVDDPGSNPSCDIDKTWTFTGAGFTLKGETAPPSGSWQCIGSGSGQNLDVLLGYKLSL
jgi:hypothetical protein